MGNSNKTSPSTTNASIKARLDNLCRSGQKNLRLWSLSGLWTGVVSQGVVISLALSGGVIGLSVLALVIGRDAWAFGWWATGLLLLLPVAAFILVRCLWVFLYTKADRATSLTFFDQFLSSKNRLVTADEFIDNEPSTPFEQAVVEDVFSVLEQAERAKLPEVAFRVGSLPAPLRAKVALSFALVMVAASMQLIQGPSLIAADGEGTIVEAFIGDTVPAIDNPEIYAHVRDRDIQNLIEPEMLDNSKQDDNSNVENEENTESDSEGRSSSSKSSKTKNTGKSSKSQGGEGSSIASSDASPQSRTEKKPNKKGDSKNQNEIRKSNENTFAQKSKPQENNSGKQRKQQLVQQVRQQQAAENAARKKADGLKARSKIRDIENAASGVMESKSSDQKGMGQDSRQMMASNKRAGTPPSKREQQNKASRQSTPNSPSQNAVSQKNAGKKANKKSGNNAAKPPREGSNQSQKQKQQAGNKSGGRPRSSKGKQSGSGKSGKSGKGADPIKKSRGVASLMLGTPLPDRIKGQKREGYVKKTQEKSKPKTEKVALQTAEKRAARAGQIQPVAHPEMTPFMQQIVQNYFDPESQNSNSSDNASQ